MNNRKKAKRVPIVPSEIVNQDRVVFEINLNNFGFVKRFLIAVSILDVNESVDLEIVNRKRSLVTHLARKATDKK